MWCLYLIRAKGDMLYTGITKNISRRFYQHNKGRGAKCLRASKNALQLAYVTPSTYTYRQVARAEYKLKRKPKKFKEWVVSTQPRDIVQIILMNDNDLL
ncbi:endonuclease [Helicoverpa armigera multiple nucleopolyhedrovirus]|uniref:Endonuclease n=1 Tax=Mamestra brassicae nuclear polyhedrosis virus TaxID=78219 RepID=A0A077D3D5_NPVMB|nr:endonuclease [Helicoverpa armigera multiple nucleopolyhedrovirus]AIL25093.1 endonuclease [Mamestra brassicae multiple nucleopolyhedrovirus]WHN38679.1 endonuclease [Mamestra brassicae multiple nucleopolyhedrovirus]WNA17395.1 endonuclease [Alphabaculovirus mabrassicae]